MKRLSRWAIASLGIVAIWFAIPIGLTAYVNHKYSPEIKIENIRIIGIDCAILTDIKVTKPTLSGKLDSAVLCYRKKTLDINGGYLTVLLDKSSGKKPDDDTHGFKITAKGLEVGITKGNASANIFQTTVNPNTICADKVIAYHPKADAVIQQLCFNRKDNSIMAANGIIYPKINIKGYPIEDITFKNLSKATTTELTVGEIKYSDIEAHNIYAIRQNDTASINVGSATILHKRLFKDPITIKDIKVTDILISNPLLSKPIVTINNVVINVDLEKKRIFGNDDCQNWLNIVPSELKDGPISQIKVKGTFGFDIQINPTYLKINSKCTIDGPTPQFIKDLSKPFKYIAYRPDGTPFERTAGPGTNDWIPLTFVDNMATALTITEDPGFWHHRGIIPQALENSLKEDIRLGRFFRGGSTITMQLAKNLWLTRNKSLGRKLQEGILTIALESGLSKEKILELYLNVVEFGPNTYGIGPGCAKFLKKYPGEISISEALYMATRLPSPNKAYSYEANKGFIKKLIAIGVSSGKISEEELVTELQSEQAIAIENEDEIEEEEE